jgi:hypothetical protein
VEDLRKAPAPAYALDIRGLNALRMRARGILRAALGGYAVHGRPAYAPCAAERLSVVHGLEERSHTCRGAKTTGPCLGRSRTTVSVRAKVPNWQ